MMRYTGIVLAVLVASATIAAPVAAQQRRVSLEGRLGTTIPVGELADRGAESGLLVEGELIYTPSANLSVFGGLGLHAFNCEDEDCEEFSSRGLHAGIKYLFARSGTATPWLRGGLLLHEAESGSEDAGLAAGIEAGGGIDLALTPRFTLAPAVRYHHYNADFGRTEVGMSWLSFSLGAHFHLR